jgi:hypothetical protein
MIILVGVPFVLHRAYAFVLSFWLARAKLNCVLHLRAIFMPAFKQLLVCLLQFDVCAAFEQAFILYRGTCPVIFGYCHAGSLE